MSFEHPHPGEEKRYVRVAALLAVLVLVTVLLYQVIDDVQRRAYQRRREIRRQQWREERERRMREYEQMLDDLATTQPAANPPGPKTATDATPPAK